MCHPTTVSARFASLVASIVICVISLAFLSGGCKNEGTTNTNNPPDTTNNPTKPYGVYAESFNRGDTWSGIDSLFFAKRVYAGTFTFTSNDFIIAGQDTANKPTIWISQDNGFTWLPALTLSTAGGAFQDVTRLTGSRLAAVTDGGLIYLSTNNGATWVQETMPGSGLNAVHFSEGSGIGVAVGAGGRIWRTTDEGSNWVTVSSGTTQDLFAVHCFKTIVPDTIIAVGGGSTVVRSTDAGLTWTTSVIPTNPSVTILKSVSFSGNPAGRYGLAGGNGSILFSTTDGGVSWEQEFPLGVGSGNYEDILVSNDGTRCLAIHLSSFITNIRVSTDQGNSWSIAKTFSGQSLYKLVYRSLDAGDTFGFVVGH